MLSTLVTLVDVAVVVVEVVGKKILGAWGVLELADEEQLSAPVSVLTASGYPGFTIVAEAVVMSLGHVGSTRTEKWESLVGGPAEEEVMCV